MNGENTKEFYDNLYTNGAGLKGYRENNWALLLSDDIFKIKFKSILDVGCGNGMFLQKCHSLGYEAHTFMQVNICLNDESIKHMFTCMNVCETVLPSGFDLAVSTDMIEHIPENKINFVINNISKSAKQLYIVAAMYDDGESHLTIKPVEWWSNEFSKVDLKIKLTGIIERKPKKPVAIFQRLHEDLDQAVQSSR